MADFGKINFSISLKPTSAFPLDARCYFINYENALTAAKSAKPVGSTEGIYHYGMKVLVHTASGGDWYKIVNGDPYLVPESSGSGLPEYTDADNDKFLRLVGGEPKWVAIEDGDGVAY